MRLVVQRVLKARVRIGKKSITQIPSGLVAFLGIEKSDTQTQAIFLAEQLLGLRLLSGSGDPQRRMSVCLKDNAGTQLLIVSEITLAASVKNGRLSFEGAAPPASARKLFNFFVAYLSQKGCPLKTGVFGSLMMVELVNDGPVTVVLTA